MILISKLLHRVFRHPPAADAATEVQPSIERFSIHGHEFQLWLPDETAVEWYPPEEKRESRELAESLALVGEGGCVVDVGCHYGMNLCLFASAVGTAGRVLGIDPRPENAMIACAQIGLNGFAHASVVCRAAGASRGEVAMTADTNATAVENVPYLQAANRYQQAPLDEIVAEDGIQKVDHLKIDVEGYERDVLAGAEAILDQRPTLELELHIESLRDRGHSVAELLGDLEARGYRGCYLQRPEWDRCTFPEDPAPTDGIANYFLSAD